MRFKNVIIPVLIILAMLCITNACAPKKAAEVIKVGAVLSITGGASYLGAPESKTLDMLVGEINAAGGVDGRQIVLITKDTQASPENAISFTKQLIEEEKVLAIIGPSTSGESLKIKDICQEGQTILLSCAAAEGIVDPVASYVFKTPQKDSYAAVKIFETMISMGIKDIGIVASNSGFGIGGKAQLEKYAPDANINIKIAEVYEATATDLTSVLTKLNNAGINAVVNWSIDPAQSIIPKNMKQLGMEQPLFQSHGFGNIRYAEAAGEAAEGIIFPCGRLLIADVLPNSHPQKAVLVKYKKDYESKFGEDASTFGGHAYDALMILAEAIKKAKSIDKAKVRDAIESLTGFVGTGGVFNFSAVDHNGLDIDSFEMLTVENGKFTLLNK